MMQETLNFFYSGYRFDQYLYWVWSFLLSVFAFVYWKPTGSQNETKRKAMLPISSTIISMEDSKKPKEELKTQYFIPKMFIPRFLQFQSNRKKLVLDLDETLISSSLKHSAKHDISVNVTIYGVSSSFFIRKRPHVDHFLETVSQWYELIVFTASLSPYANAVLDQLDPNRLISKRYYRQSCVHRSGCYVKDLKTVCRDLSKVIIIDNSPIAYSLNKENAIPIEDYIGSNAQTQDSALLSLLPLLEELRNSPDVREVLKVAPNGAILSKPSRKSNVC